MTMQTDGPRARSNHKALGWCPDSVPWQLSLELYESRVPRNQDRICRVCKRFTIGIGSCDCGG